MKRGRYLLPAALLGSLLSLYAVAQAVAQAMATAPLSTAASTFPQEWTALALGWAD